MIRVSTSNYNFVRSVTGANGAFIKAMVAEALTSDTIDLDILLGGEEYVRLRDVNNVDLKDVNGVNLYALAEGTTIDETDFVRGNRVEFYDEDNTLFLTSYVDYIERTGEMSYILHCLSPVGLLQSVPHNGGMYVGATFGSVISSILQRGSWSSGGGWEEIYSFTLGFMFRVKTDIFENVLVTGHLPIASARDNLMALLFPPGVSMFIDALGRLTFDWDSRDTSRTIPAKEIYTGARVQNAENVTSVMVREHSYIEDTNITPITLFETSSSVTSQKIVFEQPCHHLHAEPASGATFTIDSSNCNYAIVTGEGVLTGIPYIHTTTDYTKPTGNGGTEKEVQVKDMTLVSPLNSSNVLDRLVNYYANAEIVRLGFKLNWYGDQDAGRVVDKCGDLLGFIHPYTHQSVLGYLKEMEVNFSSFAKADAKIVTGWTPKYLGNTYNNSTEITSSGTFTVPAGVEKARIILIGGGKGGHGGYNGSDAPDGRTDLTGGQGGAGAEGGTAGKVYIADITLTPGDTISVTVGQGGLGGAAETEGSNGTASTFGTYSSENGSVVADREIVNPVTGTIYGGKGLDGQAGSDGGQYGADTVVNGGDFTDAYTGTKYTGGTGITSQWGSSIYLPPSVATPPQYDGSANRSGASGGGAAYGANGGTPTNVNAPGPGWGITVSTWNYNGTTYYYNITSIVTYWKGGNGANALTNTTAPRKGQGGTGGNGGGGGGKGSYVGYSGSYYSPTLYDGQQGVGGTGSSGGNGGDGIVIVLY